MGSFSSGADPLMIGDLGPSLAIRQAAGIPAPPKIPQPFPPPRFPRAPNPRMAAALAPSIRNFKIADNQSPQPQDRVFFSSNFFDNVNADPNRRFGAPVDDLRVYRQVFGLEKTFADGQGSIGLVLPMNTLTANSTIQGNVGRVGGTTTSMGDLSIFSKYILAFDKETGSLLSGGLAVTTPTGPNHFAGASYLQSINDASLQPYLGYILNRDDFYLLGFSSIDVPTTSKDVTMFFNDVSIGYFLYRDSQVDSGNFITAIAPTFETHINTPLNHRDIFNFHDRAGTADVVDLTYGLNVEMFHRGLLTFGFVTPVTGPRPFAYEAVLLFNLRFGGSRARRALPPVVGG